MPARGEPIKILIVDDHAGMREGLNALVGAQADMTPVGEAATGAEAVEKFKQLRPHVTLMDLNLPEMGGMEAIALIRAEYPTARFVVITAINGADCARKVFAAGVPVFLPKDMLRQHLLPAIRAVHSGQKYIPEAIARWLADETSHEE